MVGKLRACLGNTNNQSDTSNGTDKKTQHFDVVFWGALKQQVSGETHVSGGRQGFDDYGRFNCHSFTASSCDDVKSMLP